MSIFSKFFGKKKTATEQADQEVLDKTVLAGSGLRAGMKQPVFPEKIFRLHAVPSEEWSGILEDQNIQVEETGRISAKKAIQLANHLKSLGFQEETSILKQIKEIDNLSDNAQKRLGF